MAGYRFGIEQELALELKDRYRLRWFVETGTYKAETARWAAGHFEHVWSVEVDRLLYLNNVARIKNGRITLVHGDSREKLPEILKGIETPALLYLDAHWLDKGRKKRPDDCPLVEELGAVAAAGLPHVCMIHDAHYLKGIDLPPGTMLNLFPTLEEVRAALPGYQVSVRKDVVLCLPN